MAWIRKRMAIHDPHVPPSPSSTVIEDIPDTEDLAPNLPLSPKANQAKRRSGWLR